MNYLNGYIRSQRFEKINKKIGINSVDNEKIVIFDNNGKNFKYKNMEKFYKKYEKELNSYKMEDLMKIFEETGICVYRILRCLLNNNNSDEKEFAIGGFVIQPTCIYYWNDDNYPKVEFNYIKKEYRKQEKQLTKLQNRELECDDDRYRKSGEYDYFFVDMEFVSYVDELGKDDIGIYIVNNDKKDYMCLFKELDF